jgi:hypothetical protein
MAHDPWKLYALPWLALVDGLSARGRLVGIDWKEDPDSVMEVIGRLLGKAAPRWDAFEEDAENLPTDEFLRRAGDHPLASGVHRHRQRLLPVDRPARRPSRGRAATRPGGRVRRGRAATGRRLVADRPFELREHLHPGRDAEGRLAAPLGMPVAGRGVPTRLPGALSARRCCGPGRCVRPRSSSP